MLSFPACTSFHLSVAFSKTFVALFRSLALSSPTDWCFVQEGICFPIHAQKHAIIFYFLTPKTLTNVATLQESRQTFGIFSLQVLACREPLHFWASGRQMNVSEVIRSISTYSVQQQRPKKMSCRAIRSSDTFTVSSRYCSENTQCNSVKITHVPQTQINYIIHTHKLSSYPLCYLERFQQVRCVQVETKLHTHTHTSLFHSIYTLFINSWVTDGWEETTWNLCVTATVHDTPGHTCLYLSQSTQHSSIFYLFLDTVFTYLWSTKTITPRVLFHARTQR